MKKPRLKGIKFLIGLLLIFSLFACQSEPASIPLPNDLTEITIGNYGSFKISSAIKQEIVAKNINIDEMIVQDEIPAPPIWTVYNENLQPAYLVLESLANATVTASLPTETPALTAIAHTATLQVTATPQKTYKFAVVDDDGYFAEGLIYSLSSAFPGSTFQYYFSCGLLLADMDTKGIRYDLYLLDYVPAEGELSGLQCTREIHAPTRHPSGIVIGMSKIEEGRNPTILINTWKEFGIVDFFNKNASSDVWISTIMKVLK